MSTSCTGSLGTVPEGPRCRTAVPGVSGLGLKARGFYKRSKTTRARVRGPAVDQRSRATRDLVGGPTVLTSLPRRLRSVP